MGKEKRDKIKAYLLIILSLTLLISFCIFLITTSKKYKEYSEKLNLNQEKEKIDEIEVEKKLWKSLTIYSSKDVENICQFWIHDEEIDKFLQAYKQNEKINWRVKTSDKADYDFYLSLKWGVSLDKLELNINDISKKVVSLDLSLNNNYKHLTGIFVFGLFKELILPCSTVAKNLVMVNLSDNQFSDLSIFSHLINLEKLVLSNNDFSGSLRELSNLSKLKELDIIGNNFDRDLEYLPNSLNEFVCGKSDVLGLLLLKSNYNLKFKFWLNIDIGIRVFNGNEIQKWKSENSHLLLILDEVRFYQEILTNLKLAFRNGKNISFFLKTFTYDIIPEMISYLERKNLDWWNQQPKTLEEVK